METKRCSENDGVAIGNEVVNYLSGLVTFRNVLLIGGDDFVAKLFLHSKTAFVVCLCPTTIVDGANINPSCLEGLAFFWSTFHGGSIGCPWCEVRFPTSTIYCRSSGVVGWCHGVFCNHGVVCRCGVVRGTVASACHEACSQCQNGNGGQPLLCHSLIQIFLPGKYQCDAFGEGVVFIVEPCEKAKFPLGSRQLCHRLTVSRRGARAAEWGALLRRCLC